jgi:hypothetical protein
MVVSSAKAKKSSAIAGIFFFRSIVSFTVAFRDAGWATGERVTSSAVVGYKCPSRLLFDVTGDSCKSRADMRFAEFPEIKEDEILTFVSKDLPCLG